MTHDERCDWLMKKTSVEKHVCFVDGWKQGSSVGGSLVDTSCSLPCTLWTAEGVQSFVFSHRFFSLKRTIL